MESKFKLSVKVLHLPMVGDWILSRLANHPTLQCFLADRAIKLTNEGFEALSAPSAATRNNLRVLEVFSCEPRPRYRKADLCSFIQRMSNLSSFSMHDEKVKPIALEGGGLQKSKYDPVCENQGPPPQRKKENRSLKNRSNFHFHHGQNLHEKHILKDQWGNVWLKNISE